MRWKTRFGRPIYKSDQGITVYQNLLYRWLTLDSDAIQTIVLRHYPKRFGLAYIPSMTLAARTHPGHSCLLGLGGAGVAHALRPYLGEHKLISVELNPEVIHIANTYFMANAIHEMEIIHLDAVEFVNSYPLKFEHIMIDLFDAHTFPSHCFNSHFFAQCKSLLTPTGTLSVNIANSHEQQAILNLIRSEFPHSLLSIPVPGTANVVVLAYNNDSITPLLNLLINKQHIKKLIWNDDWGYLAKL